MNSFERRDPRARLAWRDGPDGHPRGVLRKPDWHRNPIAEPLTAGRGPQPNGPTVVAIVESACGRVGQADRRLLGAAQHLAQQHSGGVLVPAWADTDPDALAALGADYVVRVDYPASGCEREAMAQALVTIDSRYAPARMIFHDAIGRSGDVGRRFAARSGATTMTAVKSNATVENGHGHEAGPVARAMFLQSGRFAPSEPGAGLELEPVSIDETVTNFSGIIEREQIDLALPEASLILSAGTGVHDWNAFDAVARAMNATIGATRAVCDAGLLPRDRQIGASGQIVSPACYIALGISGAPQHVQGLRDCEHVVAVNTDLHAAMIKRADLAIIADVQRVMPALLGALGRRP